MHPTLPRCYLNGPYCAPGVNPYTGPPIDMYSFNAGIYEHTANLDFLYRMKDRDTSLATAGRLRCYERDGRYFAA